MNCVSDNKDKLDMNPFGDIPEQLAISIKQTMVATRMLVRALKSVQDIANTISEVKDFIFFFDVFR